ncbi:hypothetical protein AHF37_04287 [Paragonimus kellicotti]|nr:hypothetical protein AHF37_04287 [Paragonimus kellicotti]
MLRITPVLSVAANFSSVAPTITKSSQTFRRKSGFFDLNFRDPIVAHIAKTNTELLRGLLVYKMCTLPFLVRKNKELMNISRRLLGKRLFRFLMKSTFYGHFVGGEHLDSIKPVVKRIRKYGVKSILDYSVEEDIRESEAVEKVKDSLATVVHEPDIRPAAATKEFQTSLRFADRSKRVVGARTYFYESEYQCDKNMETFLHCIDNVSDSTEKEGFAAIKITALGRPQLLLQMSDFLIQMERLFHLLVKGSVKNEGNSTTSSTFLDVDSFRMTKTLNGLRYLMFPVMDLLDWSHLKAFEYDLSQLFTVKNIKTGKMEQLVPTLTADGLEQMRTMLQRVDTIARHAQSCGVRIMVDAEQTYFQPAIRRITMEMMRLFNHESAVIFNTYQCYLKNAREYLHHDLQHAKVEDFYFGAKFVRGAYMDQERARAAALDYDDPICVDYEATTNMYKSCVIEALKAVQQRPVGRVAIMMATHNEDTVRFVLEKMYEYNVTPEQRLVCFGQLFGMCDQLSFTLGQNGYSVYKYVPYGPVEEVLPYLSRRALENGSILSNTKVERQLMWAELKRRLRNRQFFYQP